MNNHLRRAARNVAFALLLGAGACAPPADLGGRSREEIMSFETLADKFIEAIESGDIEQVVAQYTPDGVQHHPLSPEPIRGHQAIRLNDGALLTAFPDVTVKRRNVVGSGSTLIIELVLTATNTGPLDLGDGNVLPATGRRIEVPAVWSIDVDADGLVVEERAYFDSAVMFRQLGLQE